MKIDQTIVSKDWSHLVPLAEKWGIGDDFDRETAVSAASSLDLRALVDAIQSLPDDRLFEWLAGPESDSTCPTTAYIAFTCLILAYDSARLKLKNRQDAEPPIAGFGS